MAMVLNPTQTPLERYIQAAKDAGCPRDQIENFIRAGIVLQPKQLAFAAAARLCDDPKGPKDILFGGAMAGGKSHGLISIVGADDCQRVPGLKYLLLRKVGKSNRENFEDLRQRTLMQLPHKYASNSGVLTFENGSRIIAGHFQNEKDVDAYLGLEYDGIAVEEAPTLTAAKLKMIRTRCRTSKDGWQPRMYYSANPGGVGHAHFKKEFIEPYRRGTETTTRYIPATVYDNSFVNESYKGNLEGLTGWQRRAWLLGDWDIAAGQFFTTFRRDKHVIDPIPLPANWQYWCALDYGFTHYTSVHLLAQDNDGNIFIVDEHAERGWLPPRHAPAIVAMLQRNGLGLHSLRKFVAGADVFSKNPSGGTIANSYRELGINLSPANDDRINGTGQVLSRLGDVDSGITPTLFIFNRCAQLIECLPALEHDPHRPEDVLKVDCDDDGIGGDDFYDSARYGIMEGVRRTGGAPLVGGARSSGLGNR